MAEVEHVIEVEHNRSMKVIVDPDKRTILLELPGNYDRMLTYATAGDDSWVETGKVLWTELKLKRNTKRKGSPRGTKKVDPA